MGIGGGARGCRGSGLVVLWCLIIAGEKGGGWGGGGPGEGENGRGLSGAT